MKPVSRLLFFLSTTFTLGVLGTLLAFWLLSPIGDGSFFAILGPFVGIAYCFITPSKIKLSYFRFVNKTAVKNELPVSKRGILAIALLMPAMIAVLQLFKLETLLAGLILFSTALMSQSTYSVVFILKNKELILDKGSDIHGEMKMA